MQRIKYGKARRGVQRGMSLSEYIWVIISPELNTATAAQTGGQIIFYWIVRNLCISEQTPARQHLHFWQINEWSSCSFFPSPGAQMHESYGLLCQEDYSITVWRFRNRYQTVAYIVWTVLWSRRRQLTLRLLLQWQAAFLAVNGS